MSRSSNYHPYLEVGTLVSWAQRLDEALEQARAESKRVLVVHGRATCGGTRALVEKTIAKEEIADFLNGHFVGLATDGDAPAPEITRLIATLPRQAPTPVCIYLDAKGPPGSDPRVVHSTAGGRPPAVFLNDMMDGMRKA